MKKSFIFFGSLLLAAGIAAQNPAFTWNVSGNSCSILSKILAEAPDQFKKIRIGENQAIYAPNLKYGWKTTTNFPGALLSFIEWGSVFGDDKYVAFFGNSQSEAMARINLYSIEEQLKACLAGFNHKVYDQENPFVTTNKLCPLILEFTGKKTGNTPPPVFELKIQKDSSVYGVYLEVRGPEVNLDWLLNWDKPATEKTTSNKTNIVVEAPNSQSNITNSQVNKFNEQLSSILADYANNFETIKGERKTAFMQGDKFYSKVELQGADSVYLVQNWTTRRLSFIAVYSKHSSKEEAREKFNELVAQIDKCKFTCCTFAKAEVSEHSNMVVQGWLPFDLFRKMEATYENILLEVEIHKDIEFVVKSEKFVTEEFWQLVLRVKKL